MTSSFKDIMRGSKEEEMSGKSYGIVSGVGGAPRGLGKKGKSCDQV